MSNLPIESQRSRGCEQMELFHVALHFGDSRRQNTREAVASTRGATRDTRGRCGDRVCIGKKPPERSLLPLKVAKCNAEGSYWMMRPLIVCARCQLKARLHDRIHALQQARRGLADTTRQHGTHARALSTAAGRYSGQTRQVEQHASRAPTGRYSRGALQPEAILNELKDVQKEERSEKGTSPRNGTRRRQSPIAQRHINPIKNLNVKLETFRNYASLQHAEAENVLKEIAADRRKDQLDYALVDDPRFCRALSGFVVKTCQMIVEHKPEAQSRVWAMTTPSELLKAGQAFGLRTYLKDRHVEVMWKLAARLVELRPLVQTDPGIRPWLDGLLHELVTLWNMALAIKLKRQPMSQSLTYRMRSGPPSTHIDWSFLPRDTTKLLSSWDPTKKTIHSFGHAISLLVPKHFSDWNPSTEEHYEYESAALVTLDELRLRARSTDGLTAESWESHRPLMAFFADMLKQHSVTEMPVALAERLNSPEGPEFQAAVERLDLQFNESHFVHLRKQPEQTDKSRLLPSEPEEGDIAKDVQETLLEMSSVAASAPNDIPTSDTLDVAVPGDLEETGDVRPSLEAATTPATNAPGKKEQYLGPHAAFVNNQLKWLGKAWQQQSLQQALRCKQEILAQAREAECKDLPNKIFEHLMLTLLALRSPQEALSVWNSFVGELGRQPTVQTYTVMMRGAQYVRDMKAMETFWAKMRLSGIKPDAHAWSTRIFGLIRSNNSAKAMKALDDLSKEWVHAGSVHKDEGDVDDALKPNLVVMNAAISALASKEDQLIPKVLGWGRQFGLEPNLVTYNVLLNISMRHGKAEEAIAILQRMSAKGIDPDSQTWTILLSAMFEGEMLNDLEPDQQQARVMSFITSLETATNVGIDQKGYALVIDRLLARYNNSDAANTILQHMITKNVQPTTHILTILMRFYFQRQPTPDFAAAEALWQQVITPTSGFNVNLDSIFYDRMIEWYARYHTLLGSTQPMMRFVGRMLREQRRPSWKAMEHAVRALAERKEVTKFRELVAEARSWTKDDDKEIVVGRRSYGQRDFWHFVLSTGELREEGLTSPDQLIRPSVGVGPLERGMQGVVQ